MNHKTVKQQLLDWSEFQSEQKFEYNILSGWPLKSANRKCQEKNYAKSEKKSGKKSKILN